LLFDIDLIPPSLVHKLQYCGLSPPFAIVHYHLAQQHDLFVKHGIIIAVHFDYATSPPVFTTL
jgi:hypothetical protein